MAERLRQLQALWTRYARPVRLAADQASDWLMGRTPRERVLLASAIFLVVATFWYQSGFSPAATRLGALNSDHRSLQNQQEQLEATINRLEQRIARADDPDEAVRADIDDLELELEALNEALVNRGLDFIATIPMQAAMSRLQDALDTEAGPRLISFERRPGSGITSAQDAPGSGLDIRHREIRVVLEGTFGDIVDFLETLEDDAIQLVWRSLEYSVTEHPVARINVRFDLYAPAQVD